MSYKSERTHSDKHIFVSSIMVIWCLPCPHKIHTSKQFGVCHMFVSSTKHLSSSPKQLTSKHLPEEVVSFMEFMPECSLSHCTQLLIQRNYKLSFLHHAHTLVLNFTLPQHTSKCSMAQSLTLTHGYVFQIQPGLPPPNLPYMACPPSGLPPTQLAIQRWDRESAMMGHCLGTKLSTSYLCLEKLS